AVPRRSRWASSSGSGGRTVPVASRPVARSGLAVVETAGVMGGSPPAAGLSGGQTKSGGRCLRLPYERLPIWGWFRRGHASHQPPRSQGRYAYSRCSGVIGRITSSIVEAVAPIDLARLPERLAVLLRHDPLRDAGRPAQLQLDQPRADLGVAQHSCG